MINTKYFADYFTNLFNEFGREYDLHFQIFADEGGLKDAIKEYGKKPIEFTSGIATLVGTQLLPIRSIRLNNYTLQIELFVDTLMSGFNEAGESVNLNAIRECITRMIETVNGSTSSVTIGNVEYSQGIAIGYPITGSKGEVGFIADCLPLFITVNVSMFQDGLNANQCKLRVNNIELPFTSLTISRRKTAEQSTFNGDVETKTIIQAQGLSIDGVMPALKTNEISQMILRDILQCKNYALCVEIETPIVSKTFIGTFGDGTASLDLITNVGYNFSIVQAKENLLNYDYYEYIGGKWKIHTVVGNKGNAVLVNSNPGTTVRFVIFWGDGTNEFVVFDGNKFEFYHNYTDGKESHTIRIFGG
ncbi:MAG: hypothetical protein J6A98_00715 [Clostridia bacterium]|nr:hypothetical protein [Clostridia bacterium]